MKLSKIIENLPIPDVVVMMKLKNITNHEIKKLNGRRAKQSLQNYFFWIGLACYQFGVMQGKRAERAKRKKAAIGAGTPTTANDTTQGSECVKCEYNTETRDMEGVNG